MSKDRSSKPNATKFIVPRHMRNILASQGEGEEKTHNETIPEE